jgi:hypothetical protein
LTFKKSKWQPCILLYLETLNTHESVNILIRTKEKLKKSGEQNLLIGRRRSIFAKFASNPVKL